MRNVGFGVITSLLLSTSMAIVACGGMEEGAYYMEDELPAASNSEALIFTKSICTEAFTKVTGTIRCRDRNNSYYSNLPIAFAKVIINGKSGHANENGVFTVEGCFASAPATISVQYDGQVKTDLGTAKIDSQLKVIDDAYNARGDAVNPTNNYKSVPTKTISLTLPAVDSVDCDLWRRGVAALEHYHTERQASPPTGSLRIKRWGAIYVGSPHAYYDVVTIPTNWVTSVTKRDSRQATIHHEFGHAVRHVADGSHTHWDSDDFEWVYGRIHTGAEITNMPYAFNEGWANYWSRAAMGWATNTATIEKVYEISLPSSSFRDWNEWRVAQRLAGMAMAESDALMVEVLEDNPGGIHSLWEFEVAYCAKASSSNPYCSGGALARSKPNTCPPDYTDTGLLCQFNNIRSKASYGRGVGYTPTGCPSGQEYDAGLCYPECKDGYDGVGPVCWAQCKDGYKDIGAACWIDGSIIGADNSSCPPEDLCGLFTGCTTCPAGYINDGCSCRRDSQMYFKGSYDRGVGAVPTSCTGGYEYDAGLCYVPCTSGYSGVGPVCWQDCEEGWQDNGATCYKDPDSVKKYCP